MSVIDPRSIIVINGLLAIVILVILLSLRRSVPAGVRGLAAWIGAYAAMVGTVVLLVLRPWLPLLATHALANALLVQAILLIDLGLRRFHGRPASARGRLLVALAALLVFGLAVLEGAGARTRLLLVTSFLLGSLVWTLVYVLRRPRPTVGERVTQLALLAAGAGVAYRLLTLEQVGPESVLFHPTPAQAVYMTALSTGLLTAGVGLILMVNERLRTELEGLTRTLAQTTEELRQQSEAKSKFLAYAGHDIRQPLQAIHLLMGSLLQTGGSPRQQEILRQMEVSVHALSELLDTLLDISRLDAGAVKPQWADVALDALLARLLQEFRPQAAARGLRLRLWLPRGPLQVRTDERLLGSVLRNLLSNALKYTPQGSVLVAVRRRQDGQLLVQVRDSGIGIAPEHLQRVFDEYFQVDNPQRDRRRGLGLGLAIVRRIDQLLGLRLQCRSQPGRGTVMAVSLPPAQGLPAPASPLRDDGGLDLRGRQVVLVEDAPEVAGALQAWLQARGAQVRQYSDADAALRAPAVDQADLYLCDYRLPGRLTGIDLLDALQQRRGGPLPGLLLTGDTSSAFIATAAASGWPMLFKPVQSRELAAVLRLVLAGEELVSP
ncbi:MAG: hybrid sensor histidine kinase/response regulator [Hylemonella sp.]